jgi:hypothetical protein
VAGLWDESQQPLRLLSAPPMAVHDGFVTAFPGAHDVEFTAATARLVTLVQSGALHVLVDIILHGARCNGGGSNIGSGARCIGRAAVPLEPLLTETWVLGLAKAWAHVPSGALMMSDHCVVAALRVCRNLSRACPRYMCSRSIARLTRSAALGR